jgi:hypothetical protein
MKTCRHIVSMLFLALIGALALPCHLFAQPNAPIPPADHTKSESNICEVHDVEMSQRTVPFAHGMIPMSRVQAMRGEWKRRTDYYPHPGDVAPATNIVLPGEEGRCVVYVCPKCEAAKEDIEKADAARAQRLSRAMDPAMVVKIENELARWENAAKDEALVDGLPPSRQAAYYLLSGLAAQGSAMEGLSEPERQLFHVEHKGGVRAKLISVFADVRVALVDLWIQDKSGSYVRRTGVLYVHRDGKWIENGKGATTETDFPDP